MKFFRGIAFQIWLPYAVVFMLLLLVVSIYYPSRQEKVLLEQKQSELFEMARSISVGIELSLEAGNFSGLEKTLRYFTGDHKDVSVIVLSDAEGDGEPEIITFFPAKADTARLKVNPNDFILVTHPFASTVFNGSVQVYYPRVIFDDLLWNLNSPVYSLLAVAFVVTALLFYFVALRVSQPISEITRYASDLIPNDSFQPVHGRGENEISTLRNSLYLLKESLDFQNAQNERLTEDLEAEVRSRTAELRYAVEKLSEAQTSARIGDFEYIRETQEFSISPILASVMRVGGEENLTIQKFLDCINPAAHAQIRSLFLDAAADGQKQVMDIRLKDGQRWIALTAICRTDAQRAVSLVGGTIQDITDRKQAEMEVHKLSLVARLTTNGIIITDNRKRILWANQSTEALTGYTMDELRGKSPSMFQFDETNPETLKLIKAHLDQEKPIRTEILNRSRTGRRYWVELHIQPFFDDYGKLEGYLAIEVDITDRKRYEEDLKSALTQEKELSSMKSRFITMTSHEFRTPLTTIQSNLELLGFHYAQHERHEKVDRYVGRITKEVGRLTNLMNDILLLGRIDSGKIDFNPKSIALDELLTDIVQNQQFVANDDRKIILEVSGTPFPMQGDPVIMNHIFFNVFSNAIKYSAGKPAPSCRVQFEKSQIVITIQDFGLGIPASDLPHIFESFHRGANVSTIQGTGLGLQITRQFVEMHGGAIALQSKEGEGTRVTIDFPVSAGQA